MALMKLSTVFHFVETLHLTLTWHIVETMPHFYIAFWIEQILSLLSTTIVTFDIKTIFFNTIKSAYIQINQMQSHDQPLSENLEYVKINTSWTWKVLEHTGAQLLRVEICECFGQQTILSA